MKNMFRTSTAAVLLLSTSCAFANGFYAGGSLGKASEEVGDELSGKAYVGYKVNENLSLEGAYHKLRQYESRNKVSENTTDADGNVIGTRTMEYVTPKEDSALSLSALWHHNVAENLSVFGRVGMAMMETESKHDAVSPMINDVVRHRYKDDHTELLLGAGADYHMDSNWAVRGEVERIGGDDDFNVYSLGAKFTSY